MGFVISEGLDGRHPRRGGYCLLKEEATSGPLEGDPVETLLTKALGV